MDALCTPTVATAAVFVSLIFLDLLRHDYELIQGHGVAGVICVFLMAILCQYGASFAAWGLLILPFVILIVGWVLVIRQPTKLNPAPSDTTYSPTVSERSCRSCRKNPCNCNT
jgi:hypothetical protein